MRRGGTTMRTLVLPVGLALLAGCADHDGPIDMPLGLVVTPLTGVACGDPDAPTASANPFTEAPNVTIAVRGVALDSGAYETLVRRSQTLREGRGVSLRVPEGPDRDVVVLAKSGSQSWFGRDTGLDVVRNTQVSAAMTLTRYDGFSCAPTVDGAINTVFPAAVTMGDGRILIAGGFTQVIANGNASKLTGATPVAWVFDPRTGQSKSVGNLGPGLGRGAATMVWLEETQKVLILGGATELDVKTDLPFPFHLDPTKALDDYVLFDPATETFTPGSERMRSRRAFARAAALSDGTVLVTGGGPWPLDDGDDFEADIADIFDPQDNDRAGGFLDIPKMRSFYPRAGHSMTFLRNTSEGLTQLLIWGGTTPGASLTHPAEVYKQSGRQQDGVNGTFAEVTLLGSEAPAFTFFHEVTRLSGNRFLATGGAPYEGELKTPRADEAWLLTFTDDNAAPTLIVQRMPGFGTGRVFHSALSDDLRNVAVVGGWGITKTEGQPAIISAIASPEHVMSFDVDAGAAGRAFWTQAAGAGAQTTPRGGQAATLTPAGTVFLVGGELSWDQASAAKRAAAEIYTPAFVALP